MKIYHGKVYQEISRQHHNKKPIWLMRQAGRYLPEYKSIRKQKDTFIEFCFDKDLVVEATLQPIRRFGFDAAIIFSDILILPYLLGQDVSFKQNHGPVLGPIFNELGNLTLRDEISIEEYENILEAITITRSKLPTDTSLIGFCGAPWTVASYMIAGGSSPDQSPARMFAYDKVVIFQNIIDILVRNSIEILDQQIKAGVDIVQIFDTWAGVLPFRQFRSWCVDPVIQVATEIKKRHPGIKIVLFARGSNWLVIENSFLASFDVLSLDTSVDLAWADRQLPRHLAIQGNLDPLALVSGGKALEAGVAEVLGSIGDRPHIFNLGHGILPHTPIENVELLIQSVRS